MNDNENDAFEPIYLSIGSNDLSINDDDTVYDKWSVVDHETYIPTVKTKNKLPSGLYKLIYLQQVGYCFKKQNIKTDELYELPSKEIGEIITDIDKFWNSKEKYKQYNLTHKRGILLHGSPGCGKSAIIQLCVKKLLVNFKGLILTISNIDELNGYIQMVKQFTDVEKNRELIIILEDIDMLIESSNNNLLLNLLDGIYNQENVIYIATTNYPENLQERFTNRPSRFDRIYEIKEPTEDVRKVYIQNKVKNDETIDIDKWVKDTKDLSLAHIKELILSVYVFEIPYEDALKLLKGQKGMIKSKGDKRIGGFGNKN
jgi:AAA+ superfamily predicted ATPase